jgi:hypothetical protein
MSSQMTFEQLEQQVAQLPVHERLKLIARVSEQLSITPLNRITEAKEKEEGRRGRRGDGDVGAESA